MKCAKTVAIEFDTVDIRDMKATRSLDGKKTYMNVNGEDVLTTNRFWNSFSSRYHLGESTFNYFTHEEVFDRIAKTNPKDSKIRICVENDAAQDGKRLLALTNPGKPIVGMDGMEEMANKYGGKNDRYYTGNLALTFTPRRSKNNLLLGQDEFQRRFVIETPVDGYGKPRIYLELLRLICQNGAIGMTSAFRTDLNVGENPYLVIDRALRSFDNEDGYIALQQRFESAQTSMASIREAASLHNLLLKHSDHNTVKVFEKVAGNTGNMYGLATVEAMSEKKQRILPAKCRVYDLINFASEVATHKASSDTAPKFQAFIGELIGNGSEYDMEGTATKIVQFPGRFLR